MVEGTAGFRILGLVQSICRRSRYYAGGKKRGNPLLCFNHFPHSHSAGRFLGKKKHIYLFISLKIMHLNSNSTNDVQHKKLILRSVILPSPCFLKIDNEWGSLLSGSPKWDLLQVY